MVVVEPEPGRQSWRSPTESPACYLPLRQGLNRCLRRDSYKSFQGSKSANLKANAANQNQISPAESSAAETVSVAYASITVQVINYVYTEHSPPQIRNECSDSSKDLALC
jgi:hypothetical protein